MYRECGLKKTITFIFLFTLSPLLMAKPITPLTAQAVEYKVYYGDGAIDLGKARYQLEKNGDQFHYTFESALALLVLTDKRKVSSEFQVQNNQIIPHRYFHNRKGTGHDFQEQLVFLSDQHTIFSVYKNEKKPFKYQPIVFDSLTLQLQLRLDVASHKQELKYQLIKSNKTNEYAFKIDGKEQVRINDKEYETIKLEVIRKTKKRQTYIWLAPSLGYLPVKLEHYKKQNKQLAILIDSYHFSPKN